MRWPPGDPWSRRPGRDTAIFDGDWKNRDEPEPFCRIWEGKVQWLKPGTPEPFRIENVEESENNKIRIGVVEGRLSRDTFQITFDDGDVWERVREAASSGEESDAAVPTSPDDAGCGGGQEEDRAAGPDTPPKADWDAAQGDWRDTHAKAEADLARVRACDDKEGLLR